LIDVWNVRAEAGGLSGATAHHQLLARAWCTGFDFVVASMAGHLIATTCKEIPTEKSAKPHSNIRFCRSKKWLVLRTIKIDSIAKAAKGSILSMACV
jgi:hypothetical protein